MNQHISAICKSANYHLRNIGRSRKFLTKAATESLVHAFISSKLDYCNSLLYGAPHSQIKRLQNIQNTAARIITRIRKFDHISPTLHDLHWLPLMGIFFKAYYNTDNNCPDNIKNKITCYRPGRSLRSSSQQLLHMPPAKFSSFGEISFSHAAAVMLNRFPLSIKSAVSVNVFKSKLGTHLFL